MYYIMDILSSEENKSSPCELLEMPFCELDELKTVYSIMAQGKLATQIDNQPKNNR